MDEEPTGPILDSLLSWHKRSEISLSLSPSLYFCLVSFFRYSFCRFFSLSFVGAHCQLECKEVRFLRHEDTEAGDHSSGVRISSCLAVSLHSLGKTFLFFSYVKWRRPYCTECILLVF